MERGLRGIGAFAAKGLMERTRCYCEPLALMVHARVKSGGRCEQLSCGCEEEKQTRRPSRRVVANCKLCRTSFRLPTECQLRFVTS
jgi:hypothetical protein